MDKESIIGLQKVDCNCNDCKHLFRLKITLMGRTCTSHVTDGRFFKNLIMKHKSKSFSKKTTREEYIHNCIFWINEYGKGLTDQKRCIEAIDCLKKYCEEIIKENQSTINKPVK